MSKMQFFIGCFEKAEDQSIFPEDTDDFYDMEKAHGCHCVKVFGTVYSFYEILGVNEYGFAEVIPTQEKPILLCYWYNGGAGLHEVVEEAIKDYLKCDRSDAN